MRRLALRGASLVVAAGLVVAACGSSATPGASSSPVGSGVAPSAAGPSPTAGPSSSTGMASPPAAGSIAPSPAIALDSSLLDLLPAQLEGLDRQHDPSLEAGDFSDPTLADIATAGTTALYIDPAAAQFAYVAVIRLKPGGLSDAQFRAWRDTFDAGACAQAGGVGGHAEASLGGHDTYIGTCTGGLTTYHTILTERGLLVSVSSVGDRRLGERLVTGLPS